MEGLLIVAVIVSFLPALVSLSGRGIWKFLAFLCCLIAAVGAIPTFGLSVVFWIAAWVFAGIAISTRRNEARMERIERALVSKAREDSPVDRLLSNVNQQTPPTHRRLTICVVALGAVLLGFAIVSRTTSNDVVNNALQPPASEKTIAAQVINTTQPVQSKAPTISPEAKKATVDKSDEMQSNRLKLMEKMRAQGVFQKVEMPGNLPRLWVDSGFHSADFETKQKFVSVVYAYYFNGSNIADSVRIYDGKTGKEIGDYSIGNPGLKLF
ncbi:hypothetical protein AB7813_08975 [Tardiphaga sp. 20_F10_N6_6]|uniref:hypothetical protein n=1 Tax=Tardiphaga sp. 20_F10_N6_6 TaxID=3240788 RepID=UPI003F8AACC5